MAAPVTQFGSVAQQGAPQPTTVIKPIYAPPNRDTLPPLVRYSRWKKSTGTFGPVGRVVATVLLLLPLPVFIVTVAVGIGIIGAGIYLLVVMPWALRDIWKKTAVQLDTPAPTATGPRF